MKIRFWQNIISPHQVEVFKYLASKQGIEVSLVVQEALSSARLKMGWEVPTLLNVAVERGMDDEKTKRLFREKQQIEIFTAPWGYPKIRRAFRYALKQDLPVAVMSETGDWRGLYGKLRIMRGRLHAKMYKKRIKFILAMGGLARDWYLKCGFPDEVIFPYAYTVSASKEDVTVSGRRDAYELVFIGSLLHLKGIDLLLAALEPFKNQPWSLKIIGDGSARPFLQGLVKIYGLSDKVHFLGILPNEEALRHLADSDLLVLPSRKDGWGAVVNEALHRGVPVLCSDACGAKSLIREGINGAVFKRGSVDSIREKIGDVLSESSSFPKKSAAIREDARRFSGEKVGAYLFEVVKFNLGQQKRRPAAPWLIDHRK
jgi:glycosyltransferase involved in cell wall biosynthesis